MEDPKELILPSALIVLGLFVFMIPGESDFEPLTAILPYLCLPHSCLQVVSFFQSGWEQSKDQS